MRRATLVGLVAAAAVTVPGPGDTAAASCVGPVLKLGGVHPTVSRGTRVTVVGEYFVDGCNDNPGVETIGCGAHRVQSDPVGPLRDITLSIRQSGHTWTLGTADAGTGHRLGDVSWKVVLPYHLKPGRATLRANPAQPLGVVVR